MLIEEKDLTGQAVTETVDRLAGDETALLRYSENAKKLAITDANERIYSVIKKVLGGHMN